MVHREEREQSQGNLCECSPFLFLQKEKRDKEKGVGKAGSQESGDRREEEENLAREQVGQCSCSLVLYVCLCHVWMYCPVNECIWSMYVWCALVGIFGYSCVCVGMCMHVSTAGRRGGSTAGRRCALQSASPPGTG